MNLNSRQSRRYEMYPFSDMKCILSENRWGTSSTGGLFLMLSGLLFMLQ